MKNDSEQEKEREEINRRIEYLRNTDSFTLPEKIAIFKNALELLDNCADKEEESI